MRYQRIAVHPSPEATRRGYLLELLERVLPVRFDHAATPSSGVVDALIAFSDSTDASHADVPTLIIDVGNTAGPPRRKQVVLGTDSGLDVRIRGRVVSDDVSHVVRPARPGGAALASIDEGVVWARDGDGRGRVEWLGVPPPVLVRGESLRSALRPGRCLGLLALVHFLREVVGYDEWIRPSLDAAFVFDDPNLHWPRYGYIDFAELAAHADEHDYHAVMAMIPLDCWFTHPAAARLFRENGERLSLVFHGNDHVSHELGRADSADSAKAVVASAVRRVSRFERSSRIRVGRVMTPPHGACSLPMLGALAAGGFDAACLSTPSPWTTGPSADPLEGWHPADVVDGLPVFIRYPFGYDAEDLLFRAYLDQPLILYGHHDDLAGGLATLSEASALIEEFGTTRWCSLDQMAHSRYVARLVDGVFEVSLSSRSARVVVPDEAEFVEISVPRRTGLAPKVMVTPAHREAPQSADLLVDVDEPFACAGEVDLRLVTPEAATSGGCPRARRLLPFLRRVATEGRDRGHPAMQRLTHRA